ncbi:uncharacterized protein zgc:113210 isoform X2 [Esox lucius]|uniref:Uncharacterized protein n=1 Tax=Esox lucius TaxID=8010 RepID=A0A3P8ZY95_ESOLU|nr:uncharacterized protein zgc:113210 isoform X2 [Esox lucius]
MDYFHRSAIYSCLQNEESARAVENAIRTAIHTVMDVIYNVNNTKILEYESKVAQRDKENEALKRKLKKAEDELTAFRVGLSIGLSAPSSQRDFGKPTTMCPENESARETEWRMDFSSLDVGSLEPGRPAERIRIQSPSPSPVTSAVIKEEPTDTGSFYIKWEMSEQSIGEQQEGPLHSLGKESDGTSSVAGSKSPGDRRSEPSEGTSTVHPKRRLSHAEIQRQYRERIRADPEKLRAYKERARCRGDEVEEDWISNFRVPWQQTPESLRRAIAEGRRVEAADRRLMVRITVDAMRVHCLNPNKKICAEIAKSIVAEYPESFADLSEEGQLLSRRYSSLLTQIKTRVEHVNRNTENRIRRPKTSKKGETSNKPPKTGPTKEDIYGCVKWHPQNFPEGETPDSLETKRQVLAAIFINTGPDGADREDVEEFMRLTYVNQRRMINAWPPPSIMDVREQWPFLFTKRWICAHFQKLTGVEIDCCLSEALLTKGKALVHFFQSQKPNCRRCVQSVLSNIDKALSANDKDLTACAAVLLVQSHFREEEDSLFLLADVNDTQVDVETRLCLPATPRLIMLGSSLLDSSKWMVSIEGRVVCVLDRQSDFGTALSVLFGCFYVFNLEYQETASATLELIQRNVPSGDEYRRRLFFLESTSCCELRDWKSCAKQDRCSYILPQRTH